MKTLRSFFVVFVAVCCSVQLSAQDQAFQDSTGTNGFFARVYVSRTGTNLNCADPIRYCFLGNSTQVVSVFFPRQEYFCRLKLVDSKGKEVQKTRSGRRFGSQFAELTAYAPQVIANSGYNTGGDPKLDFVVIIKDISANRVLPPVDELFEVKQPGNYQLFIEFQVFSSVYAKDSPRLRVVLPPVKLPVLKAIEVK